MVKFEGYSTTPKDIIYTYNGHGFAAEFVYAEGIIPSITGGPLEKDSYDLHHGHGHWTAEYLIEGRHNEVELHLVHKNRKYATIAEAAICSDGIAVIAVFLKVSNVRF